MPLFLPRESTNPAHARRRSCWLYNLGRVDYLTAWHWQQQLVADRRQNSLLPDALILLEHPSVYTLGQGASTAFLKFDPQQPPHPLHRIERGGEVTYHCPGQLVGYPILNLQSHQPDLHWYLRQLEAVIIQTLEIYGLEAERVPSLTGVWLQNYKVAALGIKVSRWITMHGFSLNIDADLTGFEQIVPCGITHRAVGNLTQWRPDLTIAAIRETLSLEFSKQFNLELVIPPPETLPKELRDQYSSAFTDSPCSPKLDNDPEPSRENAADTDGI
ncbi:MAG: lipoyl(octanoyl) transferase LipB [Acaryochloridaceae cyanobacterium SU_2_1]|nr:lipoyl(octanoyl) transferase LipB [Acaryochloridaceae cyanobacterium SU_2_1]